MTEISPVSPLAGPNLAPTPPTNTADKLISSDFNTFLTMLTTQLKNQDPLNPMDNSEYAVQLATFSGVEQQVKTNTLLESLGAQLGLSGLTTYAGWVGKDARADMPVWYSGKPVTLAAEPDPKADKAELVVTDATGAVVARQQVPLDARTVTWTGLDPQGVARPTGSYTFALESFTQGAWIATTPAEAYVRVIEVRGGATPTLVFEGGIEVEVTKITALRGG
jgi:flagellar basal-body rod modification protein FlgD